MLHVELILVEPTQTRIANRGYNSPWGLPVHKREKRERRIPRGDRLMGAVGGQDEREHVPRNAGLPQPPPGQGVAVEDEGLRQLLGAAPQWAGRPAGGTFRDMERGRPPKHSASITPPRRNPCCRKKGAADGRSKLYGWCVVVCRGVAGHDSLRHGGLPPTVRPPDDPGGGNRGSGRTRIPYIYLSKCHRSPGRWDGTPAPSRRRRGALTEKKVGAMVRTERERERERDLDGFLTDCRINIPNLPSRTSSRKVPLQQCKHVSQNFRNRSSSHKKYKEA